MTLSSNLDDNIKLTVIMPFLNEDREVENTIQSIRKTAGLNVNILLINDNSSDDFDYECIALKYGAQYIKNNIRQGVAKSRDLGVNYINTPYFILLDSHMRFYQNDWWSIAIKCLEEDDRAVYCLKCLALNKDGEILDKKIGFGAYFKFFGDDFYSVLEPAWVNAVNQNDSNLEIPCVLGASYIMSKQYWKYLKGLSMLRFYGGDEAYLSLKVWLEGGTCQLIPYVNAGHIFRMEPPFKIVNVDSIYNKLLISETLLPEDYRQYVHLSMKNTNYSAYYLALSLLNKMKDDIHDLRNYYQSIFTKDFSFIKTFNKNFHMDNLHIAISSKEGYNPIDIKLKEIAQSLISQITGTSGLMVGGIGEIIFLFEYAKIIDNNEIEEQAKKQLYEILNKNEVNNCNLLKGAAGLGIGLAYLAERGFIDIDVSELFEDIDSDIYDDMLEQLENRNYDYLTGAVGIGFYFLYRNKSQFLPYLEYLITKIDLFFSDLAFGADSSPNLFCEVLSSIRFLLKVYRQNIFVKRVYTIIKSQSEFLLTQIQNIDKYGSSFPETTNQNNKSGLTWKSGDLIIGSTLLDISRILQDNDLYDKSLNILYSTIQRKDSVLEKVYDASLYQGSAGTAYLYHKLYQKTKNHLFKDASKYWIDETFYKAVAKSSYAGYFAYNFNTKQENTSLLYGIAGVGLSLLSISKDLNLLDKLMLSD